MNLTFYKNQEVKVYSLANQFIKLNCSNFGAKILIIEIVDKNNSSIDITAGYDTIEEYIGGNPAYGALCGRYANRIANGKFILNGKSYQCDQNNGAHCLHGGSDSLFKSMWDVIEVTENAIHFRTTMNDGHMGFPANIVINYINTETAHSLTQGNRKLNSHNLKVFLCHSSGDKPTVRNLYHQLKKDGFISWFDEESLLPGQDWQLEIPKAVRNSDIVIVCLSKSSITKAGYIQKEIKQALDVADEQPEGTIFIIPLRLEECDVPERLQKWHWVNFFEESGYQRLVRSLNKRIEEKDLR